MVSKNDFDKGLPGDLLDHYDPTSRVMVVRWWIRFITSGPRVGSIFVSSMRVEVGSDFKTQAANPKNLSVLPTFGLRSIAMHGGDEWERHAFGRSAAKLAELEIAKRGNLAELYHLRALKVLVSNGYGEHFAPMGCLHNARTPYDLVTAYLESDAVQQMPIAVKRCMTRAAWQETYRPSACMPPDEPTKHLSAAATYAAKAEDELSIQRQITELNKHHQARVALLTTRLVAIQSNTNRGAERSRASTPTMEQV